VSVVSTSCHSTPFKKQAHWASE